MKEAVFPNASRQKQEKQPVPSPSTSPEAQNRQGEESKRMLPVATPISIEVASDLIPFVEKAGRGREFLRTMVPTMRDGLFHELGVRIPGIRVRGNEMDMPHGNYSIMINEVPVVTGSVDVNKILVKATTEELQALEIEGEHAVNPSTGQECFWVGAKHQEQIESSELTNWDAPGYITLHLASVLRKNVAKFVGIQEVANMLEKLGVHFPALVEETVPKIMDLADLTEILQALLHEEISIRDLRGILETLARKARTEKVTHLLAEYVRWDLKAYISHKYTRGRDTLRVFTLSEQLENIFSKALRKDYTGVYLHFSQDKTRAILAAVKAKLEEFERTSSCQPVILTTSKNRRYVRKLVEIEHPNLAVISYQELDPQQLIEIVDRIELGKKADEQPPETVH